MSGIDATGGVTKGDSLWTKTPQKTKLPEEQAGGMTASFAPNGANFLDTVKSIYNTTGGNNAAGI